MATYIPHAFAPADRSQIRQLLFGDPGLTPVVLTPLRMFFDPLATDDQRAQGTWWPTARLGRAAVVLTPQGSPILDLLCALEPGTEAMFVGLAGSLDELPVGAVCEPSTAWLGGRSYHRSHPLRAAFRDARIATVGTLAESSQRLSALRKVADCVDMETGLLFAAAAKQSLAVRSVLVVSDRVKDMPFPNAPRQMYADAIRQLVTWVRAHWTAK